MTIIANLLYLILTIYAWMIVARSLFSWVHLRPGNPLLGLERFLIQATEPYVGLFRRLLPWARVQSLGLDLSPLIALLVLLVAMQIVVRL